MSRILRPGLSSRRLFLQRSALLAAGFALPSALITAPWDGPELCAPPLLTLTRRVSPVCRSRTKMSGTPFVSASTRFDA